MAMQQEVQAVVVGHTSQGKLVCWLYGHPGLDFKVGQAYEEQFGTLPFDVTTIPALPDTSAPKRSDAGGRGILRPITPFTALLDDDPNAKSKKKFLGVAGNAPQVNHTQAAPVQPASQANGGVILPTRSAPAPQQQMVWYARNEGDLELQGAVQDQELDAWAGAYEKVVVRYPDKDDEFRRNVATTVHIGSDRLLSGLRGYVLGKYTPPPDPRDKIILQADPFNLKNDLMARIAGNHPNINAPIHAANILKLFGFTSQHISETDSDTWTGLAHIAWDYSDRREAGVGEREAILATADKYDVPHEVLKLPADEETNESED